METPGSGASSARDGADGGATNGAHGPNGFGQMRPPGRPVRKDEIVIEERGLYVESWLPERRSRRRPLLLLHGELGGSWLWERWLRQTLLLERWQGAQWTMSCCCCYCCRSS